MKINAVRTSNQVVVRSAPTARQESIRTPLVYDSIADMRDSDVTEEVVCLFTDVRGVEVGRINLRQTVFQYRIFEQALRQAGGDVRLVDWKYADEEEAFFDRTPDVFFSGAIDFCFDTFHFFDSNGNFCSTLLGGRSVREKISRLSDQGIELGAVVVLTHDIFSSLEQVTAYFL